MNPTIILMFLFVAILSGMTILSLLFVLTARPPTYFWLALARFTTVAGGLFLGMCVWGQLSLFGLICVLTQAQLVFLDGIRPPPWWDYVPNALPFACGCFAWLCWRVKRLRSGSVPRMINQSGAENAEPRAVMPERGRMREALIQWVGGFLLLAWLLSSIGYAVFIVIKVKQHEAMVSKYKPVQVAGGQGQFTCQLFRGMFTVTRYTGPGGAVEIPSTANGQPVTAILAEVFVDASVTRITIPQSVTNIGAGAFRLCTNLTAINVDPRNPAYASVEGVLFDKNQTCLIQCPGTKAGALAVPSGVTHIAAYAFSGCVNLANITIPDTVTRIESQAFSSCQNLTNVTIGKGVLRIGDMVFDDCPRLRSIYFKGNAPSLGTGAPPFLGVPNPTVYYLETATGWRPKFGGYRTAVWSP